MYYAKSIGVFDCLPIRSGFMERVCCGIAECQTLAVELMAKEAR